MQTAYQIEVSVEDPSFERLVWDTEKVESSQSIQVEYKGEAVRSRTRYYYRIKAWDNHGNVSDWSDPAFFETGLLSPSGWKVRWIARENVNDGEQPGPCSQFRREFRVKGEVRAARIYATALGVYELHLNGLRVGRDLLTPGWTSYHKRLQYQTYDVTEMLHHGANAVGAILGDGWYCGRLTWAARRNNYGNQPALLMQMHIEYADGTSEAVLSDGGWKVTEGSILHSDIYTGEAQNARLEKTGWDKPGFDESSWCIVSVVNHPYNHLIAQESLPVRVTQEICPKRLF